MSKVTSKLQLTLPKAVANQYGIKPGSEVSFVPAGESIRLCINSQRAYDGPVESRRALSLFDETTRRLQRRAAPRLKRARSKQRGWTREELYTRGIPG